MQKKRVPYMLRLPLGVILSPLHRPGFFRFAFIFVSGNPLEVRGRLRTLALFRKMYREHGLTRAEVSTLESLLDRHPRAVWASSFPLIWKDKNTVAHIVWWKRHRKEIEERRPS